MKKREVEIAEGKFLDVRKKEKIKFEDFANEFINIYSKPNKRSSKSDEYNLKSLTPTFKGRYLYEITAQDIEKFKAERLKTVSPATVNRELATLKTMLNKAVQWGKLKESPAKNVKFLREPNGRLRYLEKEEIGKLIANCSPKLRPIVTVALNTGMRRGEILGLKWHDINFQQEVVCLLNPKNGEIRAIPLNQVAKNTLIAVRKHPNSPDVFCDGNGKPYRDIRKSFYTALKKSGIVDFRFHDLRHTFASQLAMSGVDIYTISELLGHKSIKMTRRYAHLSPNHKKRAVDTLCRQMDTIWSQKQISEKSENLTIPELFENAVVT